MEAKPNTSGHDDGRVPELIKRGHPGPAACQAGDGAISSMDTSLSNSYPWSSQGKVKKKVAKSIVSIDWLQLAGCVMWTIIGSAEAFSRLCQMQREARLLGSSVIYNIAGYTCLLRPTGMGSGRVARQTYVLETPFGLLAFSDRDDTNRKLPNFYFKATGEPCLIRGAGACREFAHKAIHELGGIITEEWIQRIDLALDNSKNIRRHFVPAFSRQQFITLAKHASEYQSDMKRTGFKIGSKTSVALIAYDKLEEALTKGPEYFEAMKQRRWGGIVPKQATRFELQVSGTWLKQFGDRKADDILDNLSAIVVKLIGDERPWFRMTKTRPDRENNHQGRAETLPAWAKLAKQFIAGAGKPGVKMVRVKPFRRIEINYKRGYQLIQSLLGRSGAYRGRPIVDLEDAIDELRYLSERNAELDSRWLDKWKKIAIQSGTYIKTPETPF